MAGGILRLDRQLITRLVTNTGVVREGGLENESTLYPVHPARLDFQSLPAAGITL